jgi:hypothetical protein
MSTLIRDASLIQQIERLTADMERKARAEFLASIQDIKDRATLRRIRDALAAGNIDAAIRAVGVEQAAFRTFLAALVEAYTAAGVLQVGAVQWSSPVPIEGVGAAGAAGPSFEKVTVRFDLDNPGARQFIERLSSQKVTAIVQEQQAALRTAIEAGYAQGRGPNDIARDLIGRVGPSGKRVGGIVGLNEQQAQYVQNMRQYLQDDPTRALRMTRRDKRFDRTIAKAARDGKPLTKAQINRMVSAYERKLLALRGETIARTETTQAVSAARFEAMRQGLEKSGIDPANVVKKWFHAGIAVNNGERLDHMQLNRTEVRGLYTPFMPSGVPMQHPHDPNAPAEQVISCRCGWTISIDYARLAV